MATQVHRQKIVEVLRAAGMTQAADEVLRSLPETVDLDRAQDFLQQRGVTKDALISRMGGNP